MLSACDCANDSLIGFVGLFDGIAGCDVGDSHLLGFARDVDDLEPIHERFFFEVQ